MSYKGIFRPKNPKKYIGNPLNIIYRSNWELKLMIYLDSHSDIVEWASEEFSIPYRSPIDGRIHRYYPDFLVKKKNETIVIEVKPGIQVRPPKIKQNANRRYINEVRTYGINTAKWKAAKAFCEDRKWKFMIMTEKELGIK